MPYVIQPDTIIFDDYEWPVIQHLGWTPNCSSHVVMGATVRPPQDYRCSGPYPCTPAGPGPPFVPGRAAMISLHPCRGRELIACPDVRPNTEVCRRHYGGVTLNARGRMCPVVFCVPNEDDRTPDGRQVVHASVGKFTMRPPGYRPDSDLLSNVRIGRMCATNTLDHSATMEGIIDGTRDTCGEIS